MRGTAAQIIRERNISSPDATRLILGQAHTDDSACQPHCFVGRNEARGPAFPPSPFSFPGRTQSHRRDREPSSLSPRQPRPSPDQLAARKKTCPKPTAFPCVRSTVHGASTSRDIPESRRLLCTCRGRAPPTALQTPGAPGPPLAGRASKNIQALAPVGRVHARTGVGLRIPSVVS
jgi:hypothetical protein